MIRFDRVYFSEADVSHDYDQNASGTYWSAWSNSTTQHTDNATITNVNFEWGFNWEGPWFQADDAAFQLRYAGYFLDPFEVGSTNSARTIDGFNTFGSNGQWSARIQAVDANERVTLDWFRVTATMSIAQPELSVRVVPGQSTPTEDDTSLYTFRVYTDDLSKPNAEVTDDFAFAWRIHHNGTSDADFLSSTYGTATFEAGTSFTDISIRVKNDDIVEGIENFSFEVGYGNLWSQSNVDDKVDTIIIDNDFQRTVSLSNDTVSEGRDAELTLSISHSFEEDVTVEYRTRSGSAGDGADFNGISNGQATIKAGETRATISIETVEDSWVESTENFTVELVRLVGNPSNVVLSNSNRSATVTINDDDSSRSLSLGDLELDAGGSGTIRLSMSSAADNDVIVNYRINSATSADFANTSGSVRIDAGSTRVDIPIEARAGNNETSDQTYTIELTSASYGTRFADAEGTITILADEEEVPWYGRVDGAIEVRKFELGENVFETAYKITSENTEPEPAYKQIEFVAARQVGSNSLLADPEKMTTLWTAAIILEKWRDNPHLDCDKAEKADEFKALYEELVDRNPANLSLTGALSNGIPFLIYSVDAANGMAEDAFKGLFIDNVDTRTWKERVGAQLQFDTTYAIQAIIESAYARADRGLDAISYGSEIYSRETNNDSISVNELATFEGLVANLSVYEMWLTELEQGVDDGYGLNDSFSDVLTWSDIAVGSALFGGSLAGWVVPASAKAVLATKAGLLLSAAALVYQLYQNANDSDPDDLLALLEEAQRDMDQLAIELQEFINGSWSDRLVSISDNTSMTPPVASDDTYEAPVGGTITIAPTELVENDASTTGTAINVVSIGSASKGTVTFDGTNIIFDVASDATGEASFEYTLADAYGNTDRGTVTITLIPNSAPKLATIDDVDVLSGVSNSEVLFTADATDADSDAITYALGGVDADLFSIDQSSGEVRFKQSPDFANPKDDGQNNTYFVYVTATDSEGARDIEFVNISVENGADPDVVARDLEADVSSVEVGGTVKFDYEIANVGEGNGAVTNTGLFLSTDPSVTTSDTFIGDYWSTTSTAPGSVDSEKAEIALPSTLGPGTYYVAAIADYDNELIEDSDTNNTSNVVQITITEAINTAPVAAGDEAFVVSGFSKVFATAELIANDTDADGDDLQIISVGSITNGTAGLNNDGTIVFTPTVGFSGPASFDYTVSDGFGGEDTATVEIFVSDQVDVDEGSDGVVLPWPLTLDGQQLAGSDFTPDRAQGLLFLDVPLTQGKSYASVLQLLAEGEPLEGFRYATSEEVRTLATNMGFVGGRHTDTMSPIVNALGVTDPGSIQETIGYVSTSNPNASRQPTLRLMDYPDTPANSDQIRSQTFPTSGFDSAGHFLVHEMPDVWPINSPPVVNDDTAQTDRNTAITLSAADLLGNDNDADGNSLTVNGVSGASNGTVALNADSSITFTPDTDYAGPASFDYTVSDGFGGEDTATVAITVEATNRAPVAGDDTASTDRNAPITFTAAELLANDTDADGHALSIASVSAASNGTVMRNTDGSVTFTPDTDYVGPANFDYTVADGFGGTDTVTVTVTIINHEGGSAGNDALVGTGGQDEIYGFAGNDVINGGAGSDTLDGGSGNDALSGGDGGDRLIDGDGADLLSGGSGDDTITLSGTTTHTAQYAAYNVSSATQTGTGQLINLAGKVKIEAVIDGGADFDSIVLSDRGDAFFLHDAYSGFHHSLALSEDYVGNESTQRFINVQNIDGLGGDDIIDLTSPDYSLAGETIRIDGGEGNDVIWGSDADETILGGVGDDTIFGGIGTDLLIGGVGADTFQFTRTSTDTTVEDFDPTAGDTLEFFNNGGAIFDPTSLSLTATGVRVAYDEAGTRQEIDIALAASADEFSWSLSQISAATDFL